jgi:acyl carrier protein
MSLDTGLVSQIRTILSDKMLVEVDSPDADLLQTGLLDSLALIQLLLQLEDHFGTKIPVDELEIEDFRSITAIARLVANQKPVHAAVGKVKEAGGSEKQIRSNPAVQF